MGRDKSRLRLGRRTLLGHARAVARAAGLTVRVIRRDAVPRCGPLGGVVTALQNSRREVEVFLACDMPFVTPSLVRRLVRKLGPRRRAVFAESNGRAGFPFVLRVAALPTVRTQIARGQFSLQTLARALRAARVRLSARSANALANINTAEELKQARVGARRLRSAPA
jgi:molybdopterin-guanine dinucleotide biosynthesis protein A